MGNDFYDNFQNRKVGNGNHSWPDFDTDPLKAELLDAADYTVDVSTDEDYADIPAGAKMTAGGNATLANVTAGVTARGVVDCDPIVFPLVTGDQAELIVIYHDSGAAGTSILIGVFDTVNSGLPVSPSGGNITATPAAAGLFRP